MRRLFACVIVLLLSPTQALVAQVCVGSTADNGQLGLSGLWGRSGAADSYSVDAQANLASRASTGFRYTYRGNETARLEQRVHGAAGRIAYHLSEGFLSVCPALGVSYTDGAAVSNYLHPDTGEPGEMESSWRILAAPATLNVGIPIRAPGGVVLIPSASAGGMLWHFRGRNAAWPIDGGARAKTSQLAWVGGLGLTLGWNRLFLTGSALETSLSHSQREWSLSVGWLLR